MNYLPIIIIVPGMVLLHGVTLSVLYSWFLLPLGAPPASTSNLLGLALFVNCLTRKNDHKADTDFKEQVFTGLAVLVLYLLLGAIFLWFM